MRQVHFGDFLITALGHDGFLIEQPKAQLSFVFDPYEVKFEQPVDYIFVSHSHFDHCDPPSIRRLLKKSTKIIAPSSCEGELSEFFGQLELVDDREKHQLKNLTYWTIPAYNIDKFRTPNEVFHPKELGGVGFVVELGSSDKNIRFYHAGDTDFIEEMGELKKIDVAFLPISGTFVMTLEEAIRAAETIKPKLVIPMHFGKLLGSVSDAIRFQNLLRDKLNVAVLSVDH